jgi:hypothetical protein
MPRDAVAITDLPTGVGTATPAGTTVVQANGANIAAIKDAARLVVRLTQTSGAPVVATFKAGVNPPAVRKGIGDLAVSVPATTGDVMVTLESARFLQADGSINVDFAAGYVGKISVMRVPKAH